MSPPDPIEPMPPFLKRVPWAEITAVLLVGLNLVLLGLPGAVFMELAATMTGAKIPPDSAWPIAIYVSALMPAGFLLAIMRAARVRPDASIGVLVLWGLLGSAVAGFVFALLFVKPVAI